MSIPSFQPDKILLKALLIGFLVLALMLPTIFIANLIQERQERQREVGREVSAKWAGAQTLSGPYIFLPYTVDAKSPGLSREHKHLIILPEELSVNAEIRHQIRKRSIYEVPLYSAGIRSEGEFRLRLPKDILPENINWEQARICYTISDFKGIEKKIELQLNGAAIDLSPGLPVNTFGEKGLSGILPLNTVPAEDTSLLFSIRMAIRGSESLKFLPLSADSRFLVSSDWPDPSFDGASLPAERQITDSGFQASWNFNKANLPFGTLLRESGTGTEDLAFGIRMAQPGDAYTKTERCIKYSILIIGLSFALFFIVELFQKKAMHPVQYLLVGLALVVFYTLLLSISELLNFDLAYIIAASATILLIAAYTYGHFQKLSTAAAFAFALALLYGFTFILIRLEDSALIVGSIGLFIILATIMFVSRKINWYGAQNQAVK